MLFRPELQDGLTWYEASDEAWAKRAVAVYEAAVKRGEDDGEHLAEVEP